MTSAELRSFSAYRLSDWQRGYESLNTEYSYAIDQVEGEIPANLRGTLFRNGPGRLDLNGQRFHHPFDGDGMVCAITFEDGQAFFRNRYVRTEGFVAESAAGKVLYRGVFGTQKPGGWLANAFDFNFKNIANTNVIYWGDRLLALWEAGLPHELNPATLETVGLSTVGNVLQSNETWSAHPRIDPGGLGAEPRLVNFSLKVGLSSQVTLYELNPQNQLLQRKTFEMPGFSFIHDFAITENYYLFFQNPVAFNPFPFMLGWLGAGQCIEFKAQDPTRIWIVPRKGQGKARVVETDSCFVFHHANAYEVGETIVVDSISYAQFPALDPNADYAEVDFDALPEGQLWRFHIDLNQTKVTREVLVERCCEFPTLNPQQMGRPYRFAFMGTSHAAAGNAPLQGLLKLDLHSGTQTVWSAAPYGFVSEPIFIPKPDAAAEDDGWIAMPIYEAQGHRTDIALFDAQAIETGPIARLKLKHHIPYGLHGSFVPQVF
ncbi:MAG TPA: carotenoid oxygenase family protein [Stenomitos sp.]